MGRHLVSNTSLNAPSKPGVAAAQTIRWVALAGLTMLAACNPAVYSCNDYPAHGQFLGSNCTSSNSALAQR